MTRSDGRPADQLRSGGHVTGSQTCHVTGSQASPGHVVAQQGIVDHDVAVIILLPNLCKKVILH